MCIASCIMAMIGLHNKNYLGGATEIEDGESIVVMSVDYRAGLPLFKHLSC